MANDATATPGSPAARQISLTFGMIADTLEWPYSDYQALIARLEGTGKTPLSLTLDDVLTAILAQIAARNLNDSGSAH